MKSEDNRFYACNLILICGLLIAIFFVSEMTVFSLRKDENCKLLKGYSLETIEDIQAPQGVIERYEWILSRVPINGGYLGFYAAHQNIDVYIDDILMYRSRPVGENRIGKTGGCYWVMIPVNSSDDGKRIEIKVMPIYKSSIGKELDIYEGSYHTIFIRTIINDIPEAVLAVIAIILGLVYIVYILMNMKTAEIDKSLMILGVFGMETGIWRITDLHSAPFIFSNPVVLSAIALLMITVMPTSYIMFVRRRFEDRDNIIWKIATILTTVSSIVIMLLQILDVRDLREMLWLIFIGFFFGMVAVYIMMLKGCISKKRTTHMIVTAICVTACLVGTCIDVITIYVYEWNGDIALRAFIIYIAVMGGVMIRETHKLIEKGKEAKYYEKLALHDQLSGLYNRTFYNMYVNDSNFSPEKKIVIAFDVNNLKKCNDTLGHEQGDLLIGNSSKLMEEVFSEYGKCIRMGGDEFTVILEDVALEECEKLLKEFRSRTREYNNDNPNNFPIHIAYGYAEFDRTRDSNISDTIRRADFMMYEIKSEMKRKAGDVSQ